MTISLLLSGGAGNTDPSLSIGGAPSTTAAPQSLLGVLDREKFTAGSITYRIIYVTTDQAADLTVWKTDTPSSQTTVALAWAGDLNEDVDELASETTAPSGATFSEPSESSPLAGGEFGAGDYRALCIRYTIAATAVIPTESFTLWLYGELIPSEDEDVMGIPTSYDPDTYVPAYTARTNKRYISTTGSDANNGLTEGTAWATLNAHWDDVPEDCEVIYLNGTYDFSDGDEIYHPGWDQDVNHMADHVTIRAKNFRQATFQGSRSVSGYYGFNILYCRDWEIWGFHVADFRFQQGAFVNISLDVDGLRVIGNSGTNNGIDYRSHFIYPSGNTTEGNAPRNITVLHNDVDMPAGSGSFFHSFSGTSSSVTEPPGWDYGARNVEIAYNRIRGACYWPIFQDSNGARDVNVHHNDIRVSANVEVIKFHASVARRGGADETYIVQNNILVNSNSSTYVVGVDETTEGDGDHTPTLQKNLYWNSGTANGTQILRGISSGTGDVIQAP